MIEKLFHIFSEHAWLQQAVAGALGGAVRWSTLRDNWREGIPAVIVGCICAVYLGPIAIALLESWIDVKIPAENSGLSGFLVGLGGITITGFIIDIFKQRARMKNEDTENDK